MGHRDSPLLYEEVLHAFKESLSRALSGAAPTPVSDMPHVLLLLALLDITYAVRVGRPTENLITRALNAFENYAAEHHEAQWSEFDAQ